MHKESSRDKEVTNEQKGVRKILLGLTLWRTAVSL